MISFGVDPMTGRASAHAAGHGFITGWAIAIAGDMIYFAVIAVTTLKLNSYFKDPNTTMWIILAAMFSVPSPCKIYSYQKIDPKGVTILVAHRTIIVTTDKIVLPFLFHLKGQNFR